MPTYYIADDVCSFRDEATPFEARNKSEAAECYCAAMFDSGDFDQERPLECIVADDAQGTNAMRFIVKRTITIDDDAREAGPVEIPSDESEDD